MTIEVSTDEDVVMTKFSLVEDEGKFLELLRVFLLKYSSR